MLRSVRAKGIIGRGSFALDCSSTLYGSPEGIAARARSWATGRSEAQAGDSRTALGARDQPEPPAWAAARAVRQVTGRGPNGECAVSLPGLRRNRGRSAVPIRNAWAISALKQGAQGRDAARLSLNPPANPVNTGDSKPAPWRLIRRWSLLSRSRRRHGRWPAPAPGGGPRPGNEAHAPRQLAGPGPGPD